MKSKLLDGNMSDDQYTDYVNTLGTLSLADSPRRYRSTNNAELLRETLPWVEQTLKRVMVKVYMPKEKLAPALTHLQTIPTQATAIMWTGENAVQVQAFLFDGNEHASAGWVKGSYVEVGTDRGLVVAPIGYWIVRRAANDFVVMAEDELFSQYAKVD